MLDIESMVEEDKRYIPIYESRYDNTTHVAYAKSISELIWYCNSVTLTLIGLLKCWPILTRAVAVMDVSITDRASPKISLVTSA